MCVCVCVCVCVWKGHQFNDKVLVKATLMEMLTPKSKLEKEAPTSSFC